MKPPEGDPFRVSPEVIDRHIDEGTPIPLGTVKLILALNILSRMVEDGRSADLGNL